MSTDKSQSPAIDSEVLVKQYAAAVSVLSQTNTRRTATARFYTSLVSGLVGLLAIVYRLDTDSQLWATNLLGILALLLNLTWFMTIRAMRNLAKIQRNLLKEMELSLPHAFITRQEMLIEQSSRAGNAGVVEQYLPIVMMIPALAIMLMTNLG